MTDRESRLEEIRQNAELEYALISKAGAERALRDIDWLLSEIDRLREIEQEARAAMRVLESSGAAWVDRDGRQESKTYRNLKAKLEGEHD